MSRGALIVEFVGLPGAGKSYLAARVADGLTQRGMRVWRYEDRPGPGRLSGQWFKARLTTLGMVITQPCRTWRLWRATRRTKRPMHFMIMWWAFQIMRRREEYRHDVLIFDQGIAQLIWSIGYEANASLIMGIPLTPPAPQSCDLLNQDRCGGKPHGKSSSRGGHNLAEPPGLEDSSWGLQEDRWAGGVKGMPLFLIEPLVSVAASPDVLVHVDATSATIRRRLDNRDGSQSKMERDMPGDACALNRAEAAMSELMHVIRDWPRLSVAHDDDVAADACVDAIIAAIERRRQEATT